MTKSMGYNQAEKNWWIPNEAAKREICKKATAAMSDSAKRAITIKAEIMNFFIST